MIKKECIIKLIIPDDHFLYREGLKEMFHSKTLELDVTGEVTSANKDSKLLKHEIPDVMLLDISIPESDSLSNDYKSKTLVLKPVCILPKTNGKGNLNPKELNNNGFNGNGKSHKKIDNENLVVKK